MKLLLCLLLASFSAVAENLSQEIPHPFYAVHKAEEGKENKMMILNSGAGSLYQRFDIIRKAEKSIEVEYFIYELDETAKALTLELVAAAKRGVKVRILVDKSTTIFVLDEYYAKALAEVGVELRYYNSAALIRVSSANFRNHRKLISVDDKYAITGGRNIGNEYFDYAEDYNFLDRDILIEGPMAKVMRESFDEYFNNDISERPKLPEEPKATKRRFKRIAGRGQWVTVDNSRAVERYHERMAVAREYVTMNDADAELIEKYMTSGREYYADKTMLACPEMTYSTDRPGGNFFTRLFEDYSDDFRYMRKTLFDKSIVVDKGIKVSSPYMINSPKSMEVYRALVDRGVEIDLYTNSLASTDALYVAANLYLTVFSWAGKGINTYIHASEYVEENTPMVKDVTNTRWGTHSKTQLYIHQDSTQNEFMIGTYNYDNRSNHYNTEMGIFCKGSPELFEQLHSSVSSRMNAGYRLDADGKAYTSDGKAKDIYGANRKGLLGMRLIAVPSFLLNFLL